jgi:hypothetical protein
MLAKNSTLAAGERFWRVSAEFCTLRAAFSNHRCHTRARVEMKNVELFLQGNILTIKVDLTKEFGPSSSGKTIIIASTEGNVSIPGAEDKKIGLNVYRKK